MKKKSKIAAAGLALGLVLMGSPAIAVPYNASCSAGGGTSTFTAVKRGFYLYAWRTGTTANGGSVVYLSAGQTVTLTNPGGLTTSSRFGIMTSTSTTYAYVYCNS